MSWNRISLALAVGLVSAQSTTPLIKGPGVSWSGLRNTTERVDYFLGIPYAEPPIGSLRFKPPVAWTPGKSSVTINATAFNTCEQGLDSDYSNVSEDCLTVNVLKPTNVTGKIPVLVWIYGGGFYVGGSEAYPGNQIVAPSIQLGKPVIYVSLNYRVGFYGFPPGQDSADAGALNVGLKDQRLAIEWVQKYISYFGGDPKQVTLFGESAGAISAGYQTLYNGGNIGGAFRGMILQSGSPSSVNVPPANDPVQEAAYDFVVNATGCANATQKFECLRNAPADLLRQANKDVIKAPPKWTGIDQGPVVLGPVLAPGDVFLPELPSESLHAGRFAKVPFINGGQLDEGTLFVNGSTPKTEQDVIDWLTYQLPGLYFGIDNSTAVQELLKFYPADPAAGSPYGTGNETFGQAAQYKRLTSIIGDIIFQASRRDHLETATKFGVNTWSYLFTETVPGPAEWGLWGVYHTGEFYFVFQTVADDVPPALLTLEQAVLDYWLNFAYTLDPNPKSGAKFPYWPKYGKNATMIDLASNITLTTDTFRSEGIDFIINSPSLYN